MYLTPKLAMIPSEMSTLSERFDAKIAPFRNSKILNWHLRALMADALSWPPFWRVAENRTLILRAVRNTLLRLQPCWIPSYFAFAYFPHAVNWYSRQQFVSIDDDKAIHGKNFEPSRINSSNATFFYRNILQWCYLFDFFQFSWLLFLIAMATFIMRAICATRFTNATTCTCACRSRSTRYKIQTN